LPVIISLIKSTAKNKLDEQFKKTLDIKNLFSYFKVVYFINNFIALEDLKMKTITDSQIEKMIGDISSIKSIISKNKKVIRQILLPAHFKWLYLVLGVSLIGFCLVIHLLMEQYGSYSGIPTDYKNTIYLVMMLDWVLLAFIKWYKWSVSLSKIDKRYTLSYALEEFFSFRIVNVFLPLKILTFIICVFFIQRDAAYYVIPTISIGMGLMHNFIGSVTRLWQWLLSGYWFIVSGLILIELGPVTVPFAISISLGCGCILYGVTSWIPHASKEEVSPINT
jgi:hypothetical protein